MKYFYKDFETSKLHWTRGRFLGWVGPGGPLNVYYALFKRSSDELFIPEYRLEKDTRKLLEQTPKNAPILLGTVISQQEEAQP